MARLTLRVDDDVLRRARARALDEGTSVNALVRDYLTRLANDGSRGTALDGFLAIAEASHASSGPNGRQWTREELYDR